MGDEEADAELAVWSIGGRDAAALRDWRIDWRLFWNLPQKKKTKKKNKKLKALINGLVACWVNRAPDLDAAGGHVELLGETLAFLRAGEGGALVSRVEDAELVRVCAFALLLHERLVGGPVAGGGGEVGAAGPCVAVLRRRRRERVRGVGGRVLVVGVMGSLGVAGVVVVVMVVVVEVEAMLRLS